MKKIFDAFRNQTDAQRTFREIMFLLSFANHDNIIRLIGLHKANNDRDIYLVFEYMGEFYPVRRRNTKKRSHAAVILRLLAWNPFRPVSPETDLHNVIKKGKILKDLHKVFIMYQLFKAIKYIHSGNVIHRDLKVRRSTQNNRFLIPVWITATTFNTFVPAIKRSTKCSLSL